MQNEIIVIKMTIEKKTSFFKFELVILFRSVPAGPAHTLYARYGVQWYRRIHWKRYQFEF